MLSISFWLLTVTVALGTGLGVRLLHSGQSAPKISGSIHGALGVLGLAFLALAPVHVFDAPGGLSSFVTAARVLGFVALLLGLAIILLRRSERRIGLAAGAHVTMAVTAYVLLLAFVSLTAR